MEDLFRAIESHGMPHSDIVHLENLSDKKVLDNLEGGFRYLRRNFKEDIVDYMRSFDDLIEKFR